MRKLIVLNLPPQILGGNARGNPIDTARAFRNYKYDCVLAIRAHRVPKALGTLHVKYTFNNGYIKVKSGGKWTNWHDGLYRPRDEDNALRSMKAAQDALVDAGVVDDDDAGRVKVEGVVINGTPDRYGLNRNVVMEVWTDA